MEINMPFRLAWFAAASLLPCLVSAGDPPPEPPFGFRGMEIFRASRESVCLRVVDLDRDGLADLVYADNEDATVRLLFQKNPKAESKPESDGKSGVAAKPPAAAQAGSRRKGLNEVESDARFRVERFFTEKKVTSLVAADLDGDGKPDLAYYGEPKELEIVYQSGEWGSRREKVAIADGLDSPDALVATDIDGDGHADLVLLGPGKVYLLRGRREGGGLEKPEVLYSAFPDATGLLIGDLDGDGRPDLLLVRARAPSPFVLRFQVEGTFGPEVAIASLPVHALSLARLESGGPASILAVQGNTRRIRVLKWGKPKETPVPTLGQPRYIAFRPEGDASLRRIELGDVDGDGRLDLIATSSETAELDV